MKGITLVFGVRDVGIEKPNNVREQEASEHKSSFWPFRLCEAARLAPHLVLFQSGFSGLSGHFIIPNRVTLENARKARPDVKEWRQDERSPSCLNSSLVASYWPKARCNSGQCNQTSVGNGNHCARLFKMRSETTDGKLNRQANHYLDSVLGVVCARSLPLESLAVKTKQSKQLNNKQQHKRHANCKI